jgi:hypothetical protein
LSAWRAAFSSESICRCSTSTASNPMAAASSMHRATGIFESGRNRQNE